MTELFVDGRSKKPPADNDVNVADLLQKVGRLTMENDRLKKNLTSFVEQRSCLIDIDDELFNITQQCELFDVPRSSFYDEPVSMSAAELDLMEQFERFHFESPFYGSRRMAVEFGMSRAKASRLMRDMHIVATYPKKRTTIPNHEHTKFPYLLRSVVGLTT